MPDQLRCGGTLGYHQPQNVFGKPIISHLLDVGKFDSPSVVNAWVGLPNGGGGNHPVEWGGLLQDCKI